jgi:murein DD-endopeptidase MepM/ murein hydrolase activator NlpD
MLEEEKNKKQRWIQKLKNKYRLVVMNDDTYEERLSFRLSRLNVFVLTGAVAILLIVITTYLIAFTPLREYIPGYTDVTLQKQLYDLQVKADSLEQKCRVNDLYLLNINNIISGKEIVEALPELPEVSGKYDTIMLERSLEDSLLRAEIESRDQYNIAYYNENEELNKYKTSSIVNFNFFTPIKGIVTNNFNPSEKHYGIDIVAKRNDAIKATLDGTVIFADWTLETGYIISIQHQGNLISVYKHNSSLLKQQGNYVKAGEPIAIIGETGELSTGPHLHFELWYNGKPINPKDYITF